MGHRMYDPGTGRFLTRDPILDGSNHFAYVGNDPLNHVDPTGLQETEATYQGRKWHTRIQERYKARRVKKTGKFPAKGVTSEARLPSGKRVDIKDDEKKRIIEIKPGNRRNLVEGRRQLSGYLAENPGYEGRLVFYPPGTNPDDYTDEQVDQMIKFSPFYGKRRQSFADFMADWLVDVVKGP